MADANGEFVITSRLDIHSVLRAATLIGEMEHLEKDLRDLAEALHAAAEQVDVQQKAKASMEDGSSSQDMELRDKEIQKEMQEIHARVEGVQKRVRNVRATIRGVSLQAFSWPPCI